MSASGATAGDLKFEAAQGLPDVLYAYWAETLGFEGIRVDYPDDVAEAWEEALAAAHLLRSGKVDDPRSLSRGPGDTGDPPPIVCELVEEYIPHR